MLRISPTRGLVLVLGLSVVVTIVTMYTDIINLRHNISALRMLVFTNTSSPQMNAMPTYSTEPPDPCAGDRARDVHVATSGDLAAAAAMVTLATSIVYNTKSDVKIHFITAASEAGALSAIIESTILRNASYSVVPFAKDTVEGRFVVRSPRKDIANPLNFARFYLPGLLPCLQRVVYVDVDCVVLGDIQELYNVKILEKDAVSGLAEQGKYASSVIDFGSKHVQQMVPPMKKNTLIMSAGVFVANLTRWREENITGQLDHWMNLNVREPVVKYSGNGAGSQAIMLLALHDKYTPLPNKWNVLYEYQHHVGSKAKLLHWNGETKPWNSKKAVNAHIWNNYYSLSRAQFA